MKKRPGDRSAGRCSTGAGAPEEAQGVSMRTIVGLGMPLVPP
jgi:hypothetical protein